MGTVYALFSGGRLSASSLAIGLAFALTIAQPPNSAASQSARDVLEAGTTVVVQNKVTGQLGERQRDLAVGNRVYRDELIRTGPQAQVELKLDDDTKLALGPDAELRLDDFAIASGGSSPSIAIRLLKGTLRFLTGRQSSNSYRIDTPSATIGVRGTVFDVYISAQGDTSVLMHQGIVDLCSTAGTACIKHRSIGRIVQVSTAGAVSQPEKWSPELNGGVTSVEAFPFVGRQLEIDRLRRMTHETITERK